MGTDPLGRDVLSRMIWGAGISLKVGFVATGIAILIGTMLGAVAGYYGRWVDAVIMRFVDIMLCFPAFFLILAVIAKIGAAGGTGYALEFTGETVRRMSMEGRMTVCNMTIEAGARFGLIAPDETTFAYLKGRPLAPPPSLWDAAVADWKTLPSDPDAAWDREVELDASNLEPHVTWGTSPQDALPVGGVVPDPEAQPDPSERARIRRALEYMALSPGTRLTDIPVDKVFIGSCTNSRIEDLRAAAAVAKGRKVHANVTALVVPGSGLVKRQEEEEGSIHDFSDLQS